MQYILTAGWEDGVADLTKRLVDDLADGKKVLWLVSGGSNTSASVQVMKNIPEAATQLLTVMPVDERFGPVGHDDSNFAQLMKAGFQPAKTTLLPVLVEGLSLEATVARYQQITEKALGEADSSIGQLGIGDDGHIAGILPGSTAASEEQALVCGYISRPFTRLTLTFPALRKLTAAYAFAFGAGKQAALTKLQTETVPLSQQPAQILKTLSEAYLYNDQVGGNL